MKEITNMHDHSPGDEVVALWFSVWSPHCIISAPKLTSLADCFHEYHMLVSQILCFCYFTNFRNIG